MSVQMFHVGRISQGIRNLCLGRVALKDDVAAGANILPVGREASANEAAMYGTGLFRNYTTSVEIVQPGATDTPGDIEYSETVTIEEPVSNPLHLMLSGRQTLEYAYTVARGAYVRPATLPSVCGGLKMIVDNFLEGVVDPLERFFPGVYVTWEGSQWDPITNYADKEFGQWLVRYAMLGEDNADSQAAAICNVGQLNNLLREDVTLGGNVESSRVARALPCWTELARQHFRTISVDTFQKATNGERIFWVDLHIECWLTANWDKVSVS